MPITPLHFGPGLFIGVMFRKYIDIPTILVASVIIDIEPLYCMFSGCQLHGFFHSFIGGGIAAVLLSLAMFRLSALWKNASFSKILAGSFIGIYTHIILDSVLYTDIKPLLPSGFNPFYNGEMFAGFEIYSLCVALFLAGSLAGAYLLLRKMG